MKEWKELFKYVFETYNKRLKEKYKDFKIEDWFKAQELYRTNNDFRKAFDSYSKRLTPKDI